MEKIKDWWESLDEEIIVNKKLLFFEFTTAVLAGILLGAIFTPYKSITIASNNKDNGNGNSAAADDREVGE